MVSVCGYFNYVIYHFSDYGYKHANGIDGSCIRDNTITLPNSCTSGVTSYMKSQGLVIVIFTIVLFFPHYTTPSFLDIARLEVTFVLGVWRTNMPLWRHHAVLKVVSKL